MNTHLASAFLPMLLAAHACPADAGRLSPALRRTWHSYLRTYLQDDGRVMDLSDERVTTSEGQAYALVRAAWMDDRPTLDLLLRWTRNNLQHGDPGRLPAWRWGRRKDNTWGILDENSATDADEWMAYALLIAAQRYHAPAYHDQALSLLAQIWDVEVMDVGGRLLPLPGPWARGKDPVPLNPSYLLMFAWRSFALADPSHPWASLIDPSYALLAELMADDQLPPDWVYLSASTGERMPAGTDKSAPDLFAFDAMRIPWTLAAEVRFYDDPRARHLLVTFARLGTWWRSHGSIACRMRADGSPAADGEHVALYGALLPAWGMARPEDADALFEDEIAPRRGIWGRNNDYYGQNWAWLGVALWSGLAVPPESLP